MGIPCCLSCTSGTYTPAAVVSHPFTFNSQFVGVPVGRLVSTFFHPYHTLFGSPASFVLDLQEFIDHIALDSYYDCISGSSSSFSLGYIFVMHGCVDPHALDFFVLGLIRLATPTVQDEDPLAFMITHLLHKWIYLWRLPTHAAIIVTVAVG